MSRAQYRLLVRTFFAQFFRSESATAEFYLQKSLASIVAFLIVPGVVVLVQLFFTYSRVVMRAINFGEWSILDDTLEWTEFLFITYSMVTVGLAAVFCWDRLTFDRRDALVLGPLPIDKRTLALAKLSALGGLAAAAATAINLPHAFLFAVETGDQLGTRVVAVHFVAHLCATVLAGAFVFCAIVIVRGASALVAGPRTLAAIGSLLQFAFIVALLSVVILCPAVWSLPHRWLVNPTVTGWLPTSWFLGLFEWIRGSQRPYFHPLATRALAASAAVAIAAAATTLLAAGRELAFGVAPAATTGLGGSARLRRRLGRWFAGGRGPAAATADFTVMTLARSRAQKTPIAIAAAVGIAMACAGLARVRDVETLAHSRTVLFSIPLLIAYWTTIGVRTAFRVSSEIQSSWMFLLNDAASSVAYWIGARAAMAAYVLPPAAGIALLSSVPLFGWSIGVQHMLFVGAATLAIVECGAVTIDHIPCTRAYQPGQANLRTRWWMYLFGTLLCVYIPTWAELASIDDPTAMLTLIAVLAAVAGGLEIAGRRRAARWEPGQIDESDDPLSAICILDLTFAVRPSSFVA